MLPLNREYFVTAGHVDRQLANQSALKAINLRPAAHISAQGLQHALRPFIRPDTIAFDHPYEANLGEDSLRTTLTLKPSYFDGPRDERADMRLIPFTREQFDQIRNEIPTYDPRGVVEDGDTVNVPLKEHILHTKGEGDNVVVLALHPLVDPRGNHTPAMLRAVKRLLNALADQATRELENVPGLKAFAKAHSESLDFSSSSERPAAYVVRNDSERELIQPRSQGYTPENHIRFDLHDVNENALTAVFRLVPNQPD